MKKASSEQQRQQVTDSCLLSLAEHHHAKLVTFDARLASMAKGTGRVEVLLVE
jgi:predicted nucleic acid-binding protein